MNEEQKTEQPVATEATSAERAVSWRPCEKYTPPEDVLVIAFNKQSRKIFIGEWAGDQWWHDGMVENATHWLYLPKPPC